MKIEYFGTPYYTLASTTYTRPAPPVWRLQLSVVAADLESPLPQFLGDRLHLLHGRSVDDPALALEVSPHLANVNLFCSVVMCSLQLW